MTTPLRILYVEDTPADAELIIIRLEKEGFLFHWQRVETAETYLQALMEYPDIILADWNLPQFSGLQALALMQENKLDIPFIIISGNIGEEAAVEAMRKGATDYLLKDRPQRIGLAVRNALEQKQLRETRKQSEAQLRFQSELIKNVYDAIYSLDHHFNVTFWNHTAETIYGWKFEEIIGRSESIYLQTEYLEFSFQEIIEQLDTQNAVQVNLIQTSKSGQKFDIESKIRVLRDDQNEIIGYVFVNRDITQRRAAEKSLAESEEKFRQLAENIHEAFMLTDTSLENIIYTSPAFEEVWGQTRESLANNPNAVQECIHPDDFVSVAHARNQLLTHGIPMDIEHRILGSDNSIRWIHSRAYPVFDENQKIIRIAGIAEDITDRIKSVELLLQSHDRLRRAEQVSQSGYWEFDLKTQLVRASQGARVIYGLEDKTWTITQVQQLPLPKYRNALDSAMRTLIANLGPYDIEFEIQRPTDQKIVAIHSVAEFDASRKVVFGIIQDITVRKNAEDERKKSVEELKIAYDATIEGWSQAMDLRDEETEGHTQRVTAITLKLAREIGVPEEALIHIRRGTLLHDIGKLGVPDAILHKPGPLSPEEWVVMKKHPEYAYQMLYPVKYLRPAIDIPYCHHERWDGTGYPRGLKGEEIPLAARIFAVIDVWDALTSDRPYRQAWPQEKAFCYILDQCGKHFDPQILKVFTRFMEVEINQEINS
jgi:PAS domain S-box-containing protein/putative nucleotidyltransferase with HDIG domain